MKKNRATKRKYGRKYIMRKSKKRRTLRRKSTRKTHRRKQTGSAQSRLCNCSGCDACLKPHTIFTPLCRDRQCCRGRFFSLQNNGLCGECDAVDTPAILIKRIIDATRSYHPDGDSIRDIERFIRRTKIDPQRIFTYLAENHRDVHDIIRRHKNLYDLFIRLIHDYELSHNASIKTVLQHPLLEGEQIPQLGTELSNIEKDRTKRLKTRKEWERYNDYRGELDGIESMYREGIDENTIYMYEKELNAEYPRESSGFTPDRTALE